MTLATMGTLLAALGTGPLFLKCTIFSGNRSRRMGWRTKMRMKPGPGFASHWEISAHLGRMAAIWHGRRARRDLTAWGRITSPATEYAVRLGRGPAWRRIFTHGEDQCAIIAPPRMYKTTTLADRIYDHPGSVVAVTTRHDLWEMTSGKRATMGPVQIFNPQGVGNVPSSFRIDIVSECTEPHIAQATAAAFVGPLEGDDKMWLDLVTQSLAGLLHVAALLGQDMQAVERWSHRPDEDVFAKALASPGASPGLVFAALLLNSTSKTADSVRTILGRSLAWVANPALSGMVTGPGLKQFDAEQWIASRGTVYLINEGIDTAAEPLFRVIIEKIYRDCRMAGTRTPYGRIPNPVLFALDEVTQTAAVPLATWLATAAGDGIQIAFIVQTPAQLRVRYGKDAADSIWQLAGTKIVLSGNMDVELGEAVSKLSGNPGGDDRDPHVPVEYLREMPPMRALVLTRNRKPVIVKTRPLFRRWTHRRILRSLALRRGWVLPPYLPFALPRPVVTEAPAELETAA